MSSTSSSVVSPARTQRRPAPSRRFTALLAEILSDELNVDTKKLTRRFRRPGRRDVRVATELTLRDLTRIEDRVKAAAREQDPRLRSVLFSNATWSCSTCTSDAAPCSVWSGTTASDAQGSSAAR